MKNKSGVTNPNTPAQQAVRGQFGYIANAWKGLPDASREAWDVAATLPYRESTNVFGDVKSLTAPQYFAKVNNLRQVIIPDAILSEPALPVVYPDLTAESVIFDMVNETLQLVFKVSAGTVVADFNYIIEASAPTPVGRKATANKVLGTDANNGYASPSMTVAGQVVTFEFDLDNVASVLGNLVEGAQLQFGVRPLNAEDPWSKIAALFPLETMPGN